MLGEDDPLLQNSVGVLSACVVGDPECGKTTLIRTVAEGAFAKIVPKQTETYTITIPVEGKDLKLEVHDGSENEETPQSCNLKYSTMNCFLVCFALNDPDALDNVRRKWVVDIKHHAAQAPFLLCGMKSDLTESRAVHTMAARACGEELGAVGYVDCSAKSLESITSVLRELVRRAQNPGKALPPLEAPSSNREPTIKEMGKGPTMNFRVILVNSFPTVVVPVSIPDTATILQLKQLLQAKKEMSAIMNTPNEILKVIRMGLVCKDTDSLKKSRIEEGVAIHITVTIPKLPGDEVSSGLVGVAHPRLSHRRRRRQSAMSKMLRPAINLMLVIYELYLYTRYKGASCEQNLTGWCLASAILTILGLCIGLPLEAAAKREILLTPEGQDFREGPRFIQYRTWALLHLLPSVAVHFWGAVMVYSITHYVHECPDELYTYAFYLITAGVIFISILCFCSCYLAKMNVIQAEQRRNADLARFHNRRQRRVFTHTQANLERQEYE